MDNQATTQDSLTATQPLPQTVEPGFSTPALLFGAIILGLGLAGVIVGTSPLGWSRAAPIGLIVGGLVATIGLMARWRRVTS